MNIEGELLKAGFYTSRYVKAKDPVEAEHLIVKVLMGELKRVNLVLNKEFDPPRIFLEDIEEMDSFKNVKLPGSGFDFFLDEEEF